MKRALQHLSFAVVCLLITMMGVSYGAQDIPSLRDAKDPAERARAQALINAAKAEGELLWTGFMIEPAQGKFILDGFKAYYGLSDLDAKYTYEPQSAAMITRTEQMIQAGRPTQDITWYVLWPWYKDLLARGYITRYESPYYKDYTLSHESGNSVPGYWVSDSYAFAPMWNPDALAKRGIKDFTPTSWGDLTDPKFTKLASIGNMARAINLAMLGLGLNKVLGKDWFLKMAKLEPAVWQNAAEGRDWSASGEYPLDVFSHAKNASQAKATGATIKMVYPKEGTVAYPFAPIIMAAGKHQNAAKLFIDYVRSAPGAERVAEAGAGLLIGRPGIKMPPNEFLPSFEQIKVIPMKWDEDTSSKNVQAFQDWVVQIKLNY
jgi:ABC-type Fe3+ transport system substrate-binding protein